mgnify:CR=1 FL=1
MAYIEVDGGNMLQGEINIQGSKNAVLPILAASVLNVGTVTLRNCPQIGDVENMLQLLTHLGCQVNWQGDCITINTESICSCELEEQYAKAMRSSVFFMGALLGRLGCVKIPYPGGCSIGARPIDIHLQALRQMDVEIEELETEIACQCNRMKGANIVLQFPSVGATENIIMAAVNASGVTVIENGAREPEIEELCCFLQKMGAEIYYDHQGMIVIVGGKELSDVEYTISSDRIVAGSYLAAAAGTGGEVTLWADCGANLGALFGVLEQIGCQIVFDSDKIYMKAPLLKQAVPYIVTKPYPGFPTDMQSQITAILSTAVGTSIMEETIFESRYENVKELRKMGADIIVDGRIAKIYGVSQLYGTDVYAHDLRGGAALVIAGLMAEGTTRIYGVPYIERGYEDICSAFCQLGAKVRYC